MHIYTPPDLELDSALKKIWIFNCTWTEDQIQSAFETWPLDKDFDFYLYDISMKDPIWEEGMKHRCFKRYNCRDYPDQTPVEILQRIYNDL